MATDYERLAVLLEARVADFEKKIANATRNADRNFKKMEKSAEGMRDRMGKAFGSAGTLAKASLAGLFAGVIGAGGAGIVMQLGDIAKGVAEIGDAAKMAGVSSRAFQEWRYVAEQARIPIDSITDGLKEMAIRADEFATTGKGSAAEAFQRLGLTPQEVKERLKDPSELLLLLIERTRKLNDVQAGVRIFDELFGGTGGERMVSLIEQGETGIRDQIKAANDFGRVLDDDVIKKAAEIDRQFNSIAGTIGMTLKSAIVSVVGSMVDFLDSLRTVEKQRNQTIQGGINDIMAQKQEVAKALAAIDAADSKLNDRQKARAKGTHEITMAQLNERENALIKELESRPSVMNFTPKSSDTWTPPTKYTPPPATGGSSARDKAAREAERERQAVTDLIADLQLEYDMIGKTEAQKAKMNALRQAGAAATTEEQLAIAGKIDAIYRESDAYEKVQAAAEEATDASRDFAGTLVDGMLNGASATETLGNALKGLASRLLNSGLDSLFSGGGLLGGLFGGGGAGGVSGVPMYDTGGYTGDGGKYQPAGVVHKGEYVFDKAAVKAAGGPAAMEAMRRNLKGYANGGAVGVSVPALSAPSIPDMKSIAGGGTSIAPVIHFSPNIDARGAGPGEVARIEQSLQKLKAEIPYYVDKGIATHRQRNIKVS
ncbi:phage tail tape measure protein [Agrobacterium tumefaciens]|uniref:Phage tail tape measure protein n=1 Tax=Agrobacterium tumefaciens TaxID=358 RepID=A0A4D7YN53_AGRTU|nr:phage tail tape measure protein [Agrobacterium tumefaciens]QCL92894.1 phage tail tape measure protein [Agrobacterium tumefaciens]